MEYFYSNAQWPANVYKGRYGNSISSDKHSTKESAQAVCNLLMVEGFGGDRSILPLRTWISNTPEGD